MIFAQFIKPLAELIIREVRILQKNSSMFLLLFAAPIIYSFLYTTVYIEKKEQKVPVAVVDYDMSSSSREIVRQLDAHEQLETRKYKDIDESLEAMHSFKVFGIIVIPEGYEKKLKLGRQVKINVSVNTTRFMMANDIVRGVNDLLTQKAKNSTKEFFQKRGYNGDLAEVMVDPLRLQTKSLFNTLDSYGDFIIFALLALILQQTLLINISVSIAHENETKGMDWLLADSRISLFALVAGKTGLYFLFYCAFAFLFFTFHFIIFKLPVNYSAGALSMLITLHFFTTIVIAFLLSTYIPTKAHALILFVFSSYPLFLLSGYSWPVDSFPEILKFVSQLVPSTPFFLAYTKITQENGTLQGIQPQLLHIGIILICCCIGLYSRMRYLRSRALQSL